MNNWKTTVQGYLSVAIPVAGVLIAAPPPHISPIASYGLFVFSAVGKIILAHFQQDAGTTTVMLPGGIAPVEVASHEVPFDKKAIPVNEAPK
jgi:hypothetical protein